MMEALVVLYEGFTEYEYQIPVLALHYYGIPFQVIGLETREIAGMIDLRASLKETLSEADTTPFAALVLPGVDRSRQEDLLQSEPLLDLIRMFDRDKKLIAAVCSAPLLLGRAGVLKGRRFCADVGAHPVFTGAVRVNESAVRDGHLITGLGSRVFHFTALLVEALAGAEAGAKYRQWAGL